MSPAGRAAAFGADLICLIVFAYAGGQSHEPGEAVSVVLAIVWPFAAAALAGHLALLAAGRRTDRTRWGGLAIVGATYALGMALRALSGRGLAPGFLIVAAIFLAVTMLGWRAAVSWRARRGRG